MYNSHVKFGLEIPERLGENVGEDFLTHTVRSDPYATT